MNNRIETLILYSLLKNDEYTRKVLPFIQQEYFGESTEKVIYSLIQEFVNSYNSLPTSEALLICLDKDKKLDAKIHASIKEYIKSHLLEDIERPNQEWLLDETEKWCKNRAIYNAISKSIQIVNGEDKNQLDSAIPDILKDALAIGFNSDIGHDYLENSDERYEFYHNQERKIEFDIDLLNKITDGGIKNKTLFVIVAGTGAGKSLSLCHFASSFLVQGKNVLYITLEMSDKQIAKRIDANLLNISMSELERVSEDLYKQKIEKLKNKASGKLKIKEYPTASANVNHFRNLINELHLKKNFKPDIIIVDYLNIAASSRIKAGSNTNSYTYIKSIAEELRGLSMEFNVPVLSATQTNRQGQHNTDLDFEDVSESHGLSATADYMLGMITTEELDKLNQVMFKQIKNRYGDPAKFRRFVEHNLI